MDMAVGSHSFGCPESALHSVGYVQLGKYYRVPTDAMMGVTDSKVPDAQATAEKMQAMLLPALAGADCITMAGGLLDFALAASFEQLVIDNEIVGEIQRTLRGFEVNDNTLAVDVIKEVGIGGNYLVTQHTLENFRKEFYFPRLFDRTSWETWERNGAKDLLARATEKASSLLSSYAFTPVLPKARIDRIDAIVKEVCAREGVTLDPAWLA
jgi:trimethylamine--corrinoid protein Co-methyltransferase